MSFVQHRDDNGTGRPHPNLILFIQNNFHFHLHPIKKTKRDRMGMRISYTRLVGSSLQGRPFICPHLRSFERKT